jgi:hypothetical protein
VGRNEDAVCGRLLDGGPDRRLVQLDDVGLRAAGQDGARDDQLDQVGPAGHQVADPLARVRGRANDSEPEVGRENDVVGQPGHLAAATGRGDVRAGALHPGSGDPARVDRVPQRDVHERPIRADVANAREPGIERRPGVADAGHRLLGGARGRRRDPGELHVADQVAVAVDEPGQDGETVEVECPGTVGDGVTAVQDRLDASVADEELATLEDCPRFDVEEVRAADDEVVGHGRRC